MLWTVFMLVMLAWMLGLIFRFQFRSLDLVMVPGVILAFTRLVSRLRFQVR